MKILLKNLWLCVLCACVLHANVQRTEQEIRVKEKELKKIRSDIQAFEKKLKESEKKEKITLENLDDIERQTTLIRKLIRKLREEELNIAQEIDITKKAIADLEKRIQFLKLHYAHYVESLYKRGRIYDIELLFSSQSINQLIIRIHYFKKFSEQRQKDLQAILDNKTELELRREQLQIQLDNERNLIAEKSEEEKKLETTFKKQRLMLAKIRSNKKVYQTELNRKTEAFKQIERIIAQLIEQERIRKEREEAERRKRESQEAKDRRRISSASSPDANDTFITRKGKLSWPVTSGVIQSHFGKQVHPVLKTVTHNTGIDIATPFGSDVFAVADGEVAVVSFIPGFGNVVILNHNSGYRTVYAHLSDIFVTESQSIKEGTVIGKSGETVAGALLHFEIWKDRDKQDPEWWLSK